MCSFAETTHTPQGDGNFLILNFSFFFQETTHTPQGDGNCVMLPKSRMYFKRNNPHPVRGRKHQLRCYQHFVEETTYPPLGDEKPLVQDLPLSVEETTHTPQGDGNFASRSLVVNLPRNNPHPVKGRKLDCLLLGRQHLQKQATPRKGTETFFCSSLFCLFVETTHTPQGDGTVNSLSA